MSLRARGQRHLKMRYIAAVALFLTGVTATATLWQQDLLAPVLLIINIAALALLLVLALRSSTASASNMPSVRLSTKDPGIGAATVQEPHPWKDHPEAKSFEESGVLSQSFYESVTGKKFARAQDAAAHYLAYGFRNFFPPNPFVDMQILPTPVQDAVRRGRADEFLLHVTSTTSRDLGAAFNLDFVETEFKSNQSILAQFLQSNDDMTLLPVEPSSPLFGVTAKAYAETVTEQFRKIYNERAARQPRVRTHWDETAESAWKEELLQTPLSEKPLISVVMPVKDRSSLVREAIASIRAQGYDRWELLVVDDHSTDGTLLVLEELAAIDSRITVLRNAGVGVSAARNAGLSKTNGEYVAFLDSDNTWTPDFLDCMVRAMLRDNLDWAYSGSKLIDLSDSAVEYMAYEGGREHFLIRNHIDINVMVARADLIVQVDGFDESLKRWVDYDLVLRLLELSEPRLLPFIGCNYDHSMTRKDRITVKESTRWQGIVLSKHLLNWDRAALKDRLKGRVSVVLPTFETARKTLEAVESILEHGGLDDVEIIVVDEGSSEGPARKLIQHLAARDNVRIVRQIRNFGDPIGKNLGFLESTGEYVLFIDNELKMREGSLKDLVDQLQDETVAGVNPLLLKEDDTIASAGVVWTLPKTMPVQFQENHPKEDASHAIGYAFSAAHKNGLLLRSADFIAVEGFAPEYVKAMYDVDLTRRLSELRSGGFRVAPSVVMAQASQSATGYEHRVVADMAFFMDRWRSLLPRPDAELYEKSELSILQVGPDSSLPRPQVAGTSVTLARKRFAARRWGIKNPADPGRGGDGWGDTHFITSFAESLRKLDQEVVTFRHSSHAAQSVILDDVSLVIRGLHRTISVPGKLNILWIISHPDKITREELECFDLVYAASHSWSKWATEEYGVEVRPLLQATDPSKFYYKDKTEALSSDVVFVGGHFANRERKVVLDAVAAGVDLMVYGPGWKGVIPDKLIGGAYVKNEELAEVYRNARFVLADHWELMAREGFIQNRLFDAVSSGCQVISDDVKGLRDVFGEEVLVATGPDDIRRYVDENAQCAEIYLQGLLRQASSNVMNNHSFEARARQLIADVEEWEQRNKWLRSVIT